MILTADERAVHKRIEMLERDRAALAAEVAALRMALGCVAIVAGTSHLGSQDQVTEITAITGLALGVQGASGADLLDAAEKAAEWLREAEQAHPGPMGAPYAQLQPPQRKEAYRKCAESLLTFVRPAIEEEMRRRVREIPKEDGIAAGFLRRRTVEAALASHPTPDGGQPFTLSEEKAIQLAREDPAFRERLRRSIDENKELLDRLATPDGPASPVDVLQNLTIEEHLQAVKDAGSIEAAHIRLTAAPSAYVESLAS